MRLKCPYCTRSLKYLPKHNLYECQVHGRIDKEMEKRIVSNHFKKICKKSDMEWLRDLMCKLTVIVCMFGMVKAPDKLDLYLTMNRIDRMVFYHNDQVKKSWVAFEKARRDWIRSFAVIDVSSPKGVDVNEVKLRAEMLRKWDHFYKIWKITSKKAAECNKSMQKLKHAVIKK